MKYIKKISTLIIVFAIALSLIITKETNVSAKTGNSSFYPSSSLVKTKTTKTKYKNGKIKTKTTYYKSKKNHIPAMVTIYRKYNKSGKEYYAKTTTILPYSENKRHKKIDVFSSYKKNGKTLGYTKFTSKSYFMKKSKGKWKYNRDYYVLQQTTSKGVLVKSTQTYYDDNGKIGRNSRKNVSNYYSNGEIKNSTDYKVYNSKFIRDIYYTNDVKGNTIYTITFDNNGNYDTKVMYKNGEEYQYYTWNGKAWILD